MGRFAAPFISSKTDAPFPIDLFESRTPYRWSTVVGGICGLFHRSSWFLNGPCYRVVETSVSNRRWHLGLFASSRKGSKVGDRVPLRKKNQTNDTRDEEIIKSGRVAHCLSFLFFSLSLSVFAVRISRWPPSLVAGWIFSSQLIYDRLKPINPCRVFMGFITEFRLVLPC